MRGSVAALMVLSLVPGVALARRQTLVELFVAQGCATCARADDAVAKLIDRPGVLVLTWSVDYWDYLGWKDTFAQPSFGERQRAYDTRFGLRDVFTPQVIVEGLVQGSGERTDAIDGLVRQARDRPLAAPDIALASPGRVAVGSGRRLLGGADVWLMRYDPKEITIDVRAGDIKGTSVVEHNVVRQFVRLGAWSGRPKSFSFPTTTDDSLKTVVIVQTARGGPVIGFKGLD